MTDSEHESLARWDSTPIYVRIAKQHYESFQSNQKKLADMLSMKPQSEDDRLMMDFDLHNCKEVSLEHGYTVVIFAAIALESHINEYASRRLGSGYFDKHIDRLDTVSKWVLVPKLVTGIAFPRDRMAFQLLRNLIRWRNDLVHPKAKDVNLEDIETDFQNSMNMIEEFTSFIPQAINAIEELGKAAILIDPDDPLFGKILRGLNPVE